MAAKDRLVSARHVGGVSKVPNGHGRSIKREEGTATESEDAHSGLH